MSRWDPDASARLHGAALELFAEQGFADTTVPQITARAGLTTRTFFRHFADKREVLFAGEDDLPKLARALVDDAPDGLDPMDVVAAGLDRVAVTTFEGRRDELLVRKAIIQSDESLRERELSKISGLSAAIRDGFLARGVDELTATVTAGITMNVFSIGIARWLDDGHDRSLADILRETMKAVRAVASGVTF